MDTYELYHYGIKGQRWGVRRFQKKNGSLTPAGKKRQKEKWSEDATEASKIGKKSVKAMSNAELKRLNERTRLEQEYSRLNPSNRKKALAAVTATAATMGTLLNLYNNSDKIIAKGKPIVSKLLGPAARKAKDAMAIGMWSDIHSDELYHYGVKGMKWGIKKNRGNSSKRQNKLAKKRDDLVNETVREANRYFTASKSFNNSKTYSAAERAKYAKQYRDAGKEYLEANKKLMNADLSTVSKKELSDIYYKAARKANEITNRWEAYELP